MLISRKPETDWEFEIQLMKAGEPDETTTEGDVKKLIWIISIEVPFTSKPVNSFL